MHLGASDGDGSAAGGVQGAAQLLADLRLGANGRTDQLEELPLACRPTSLPDAYAIQECVRSLLEESPSCGPQVGWKIGCTTEVMQRYLNIPHPCAGTLYRATTHSQRATLHSSQYFQLGLECEIAVRLSSDLTAPPPAGGHTRESVSAAVGGVMAAVEVVDHRFKNFSTASTPSLVADDFFSVGCVLGEERRPEELGDLAELCGGLHLNGADSGPELRGRGDAILGHPLNALAWLAGHAGERFTPLRAGQVVTLGSVVKTIYPTAGTHQVVARFNALPDVIVDVVS